MQSVQLKEIKVLLTLCSWKVRPESFWCV